MNRAPIVPFGPIDHAHDVDRQYRPNAAARKLTTLAALASPDFSLDQLMAAILEDAVNAIPTACYVQLKIFRDGETMCTTRDGNLVALSKHDKGVVEQQINIPILRSGTHCGQFSIRTPYPFDFQNADLQTAQLLAAAVVAGLDRLEGDEARRRFENTFVHAPVGIAHVGTDGRFLIVNDEFVRITRTPREDLLKDGFQKITHPDDLADDLANVRRLLDGEAKTYKMAKRYICPDGAIVWVLLTVALIRTRAGAPDFFISVIEEIEAE